MTFQIEKLHSVGSSALGTMPNSGSAHIHISETREPVKLKGLLLETIIVMLIFMIAPSAVNAADCCHETTVPDNAGASAAAGACLRIPRPSESAVQEPAWRLQPISGYGQRTDLLISGSTQINEVKHDTGLEEKEHRGCCAEPDSHALSLEGKLRQAVPSAGAGDASVSTNLGPYEQFALWLRDQINPSLCPFILCQRSCAQTDSPCNQLNVSLLRRFLLGEVGASGCCSTRSNNPYL